MVSVRCKRAAVRLRDTNEVRTIATDDVATTNDLTTNVAAFCALLREEYDFSIGQAEAHDALRALDAVGISDEPRVRSALRLVCCGNHDQTLVFDHAFEHFFRPSAMGVRQSSYQPRNTRPGREKNAPETAPREVKRPKSERQDGREGEAGRTQERRRSDEPTDDATAWQLLRARYSPAPAHAQTMELAGDPSASMRAAVRRLIASVRLGRSRRWKAAEYSGRFDLRRTVRASLQTGGDLVDLHFIGHPLRNPRFVMLIDGSRSMSEQTTAGLEFARALVQQTLRTNVFVFSTDLREVTRELRARETAATNLGEAWGGGTKIGANLGAFVTRHGPRVLTPDTLVIIYSDGLDVGDIGQLEGALRNIDRRSAGIVWLNPHAARPGYVPAARGMRAALPYLSLLTAADDAPAIEQLAHDIARNARIRGHRR